MWLAKLIKLAHGERANCDPGCAGCVSETESANEAAADIVAIVGSDKRVVVNMTYGTVQFNWGPGWITIDPAWKGDEPDLSEKVMYKDLPPTPVEPVKPAVADAAAAPTAAKPGSIGGSKLSNPPSPFINGPNGLPLIHRCAGCGKDTYAKPDWTSACCTSKPALPKDQPAGTPQLGGFSPPQEQRGWFRSMIGDVAGGAMNLLKSEASAHLAKAGAMMITGIATHEVMKRPELIAKGVGKVAGLLGYEGAEQASDGRKLMLLEHAVGEMRAKLERVEDKVDGNDPNRPRSTAASRADRRRATDSSGETSDQQVSQPSKARAPRRRTGAKVEVNRAATGQPPAGGDEPIGS